LQLSPAHSGPGTQALLRLPMQWHLPDAPASIQMQALGTKRPPDDTVYA